MRKEYFKSFIFESFTHFVEEASPYKMGKTFKDKNHINHGVKIFTYFIFNLTAFLIKRNWI